MSGWFRWPKKTLLELQEEYQTRIDTIEDHIQNPQDELNKDWEDRLSYSSNRYAPVAGWRS